MHDPRPPLAPPRGDVVPIRRPADAVAPAGGAGLPELVTRLHAAIATYVRGRRDADVPLDHLLREVRDLVRDAEVAEGSPDELGVLAREVVRWTVAAYADDPGPRAVPRPD